MHADDGWRFRVRKCRAGNVHCHGIARSLADHRRDDQRVHCSAPCGSPAAAGEPSLVQIVVGFSFGKAALCSVAAPARYALACLLRVCMCSCAPPCLPARGFPSAPRLSHPATRPTHVLAHSWTIAHAPSSSSTGRSTRSTGLSSRGMFALPPACALRSAAALRAASEHGMYLVLRRV